MLLRDIDSVNKSTTILEKLMNAFTKRDGSPIKLLSFTLRSSNSTILNLIHGKSHNMEHYMVLFSYYSRSLGWKEDFSRVPELLEKALKEGNTLVIGVKDRKTGEVVECADLFGKE